MLYVLLFAFLAGASAKSLPADIKKCRKSDPNLSKCLETSAMDAAHKLALGNVDLGVVPLEPFVISQVNMGNSSSGSISLQQTYKNMKLYGLTNTVLRDSEANLTGDNCYWRYKSFVPQVRMESDYQMKGQLMIFPINGHGKCNNTMYDIDSQLDVKCERYMKKNKRYLRVTEFNVKMNPKKIVFDYDNVIDGNEQLSREVLKTLNENSVTLYAEVAPSFEKIMGTVWKLTINQIFSRIPEDELFLP